MSKIDVLKATNTSGLEANGVVSVHDLATEVVVASYEGLAIHKAMVLARF